MPRIIGCTLNRVKPAPRIRALPCAGKPGWDILSGDRARPLRVRGALAALPPAITCFRDDETGFVNWRDGHPGGYIVNSERNPIQRRQTHPVHGGAGSFGAADSPYTPTTEEVSRTVFQRVTER